mmetsp:Transcript_281/g.1089  ORF Transcript_281/g.1089 Transcript_281/m.1089 type:complete len:232 (-) Transcript_281:371-1066(-)
MHRAARRKCSTWSAPGVPGVPRSASRTVGDVRTRSARRLAAVRAAALWLSVDNARIAAAIVAREPSVRVIPGGGTGSHARADSSGTGTETIVRPTTPSPAPWRRAARSTGTATSTAAGVEPWRVRVPGRHGATATVSAKRGVPCRCWRKRAMAISTASNCACASLFAAKSTEGPGSCCPALAPSSSGAADVVAPAMSTRITRAGKSTPTLAHDAETRRAAFPGARSTTTVT